MGQPRRHMPNNHEHASSALMYPEKHVSPDLFINTIPYLPIWYLANLNILACYFSFSTHLFNSTLKCARTTRPKLNRLFRYGQCCPVNAQNS